jgi:YVTN family beta-propeller protein
VNAGPSTANQDWDSVRDLSAAAMLEFRILGPLEAGKGDRSVPLGGPLQRAVLAILILNRGEVVTSDRLIDELWGESPPPTAAKTVQAYVSRLRKALGADALLTASGGYVLAAESDQVDAERFDALAAEGRAALADGDPGAARKLLASALALWRGEALSDLAFRSFAARDAARLEEARLVALEDRIEADLSLGRHRELVGELEKLVARHPHRERPRAQLMLALYRSGRHTEALETYRRGRRALADELGLQPGPALRALEQRILDHDPTLEQRSATAPRARTNRRRVRLVIVGALLLAGAIAVAAAEPIGGSGPGMRAAPNSVAAIDVATNRVTATVSVGARPGSIAYGLGSLWVANLDDQTVSRVNPTTLAAQPAIELADPPTGIAIARGAAWVVESDASAMTVTVSRIDPQFDVIEGARRVDNVVPGAPASIAAGRGDVWVAPTAGPLAKLDPRTDRVVSQINPNAMPTGLAVGAGAVWMTDSEADNVIRVDPSGVVTPVPVGNEPSGIAVGDGGVWVADTGDDAVVRVDPSTDAVTTTIPVGQAPTGVAVGAGSVWVTDSDDGTVERIDPKSERVLATIAVGGSPQAIVIADGRAWVTVDARAVPPVGHVTNASGTVRLDSVGDVTSMDPALAYDPLADQLLYATCAKLVNYPDRPGPAGWQLVPEVAQTLPVISNAGRTYTFTIRPGFRFAPPSNERVTAQTFKDTIARVLNPRMRSPVAYEYRDIVGAAAYMAGRASQISGVLVHGDTLTIKLVAPAPDLPARLAEPAMCAVPSDTPINPQGVRVIPSAGPYTVQSYVPNDGIVLVRNPNYQGDRPRRPARIEVTVGIPPQREDAQVLDGIADYTIDVAQSDAPALAARYGRGSPAARRGRQQYFVNASPQLDLFALNTHRALFSNVSVRQAVNYAINREALAALGDEWVPLPEHPTSHYLPPGVPGNRDVEVYPLTPDLRKARSLARSAAGKTAVLYTCDVYPCPQQAEIVKNDLAAIGITVQIHAIPDDELFAEYAKPGPAFDLAWSGWIPDYLDPDAMLGELLEDSSALPTFDDSTTRAQLAAAARLSGPERYLTYARLDSEIARKKAPLVAFGNVSSHDLFSARIGCQTYGVYGMDLAALCIRK